MSAPPLMCGFILVSSQEGALDAMGRRMQPSCRADVKMAGIAPLGHINIEPQGKALFQNNLVKMHLSV